MIVTASILSGIQLMTGPFIFHLIFLGILSSYWIIQRLPDDETKAPFILLTPKGLSVALILIHILTCVHNFIFLWEFNGSWGCKEKLERYNKMIRFFVQAMYLTLWSLISTKLFLLDGRGCEHKWGWFKIFLIGEWVVFTMNIVASMVFMTIRSVFHNQISWDIEEEEKWELTDALIANKEQIDLFQQFFTPCAISLTFIYFSGDTFDFYHEINIEESKTVANVFLYC